MQWPENFAAARRFLDLSFRGLAIALQLESANHIREYESGKRQISGPIGVCLYYFLQYGVPDWFIDNDGHEHSQAQVDEAAADGQA